MKTLHLYRFAFVPEWGIFGEMKVAGTTLYTVERPWLNNAQSVSAIPNGTYQLTLDPFKGKYIAPLLMDVPNRSQVQIHIANLAEQLEGCIAVGLSLGMYRGKWAIQNSTAAFNWLMANGPYDAISIQVEKELIP